MRHPRPQGYTSPPSLCSSLSHRTLGIPPRYPRGCNEVFPSLPTACLSCRLLHGNCRFCRRPSFERKQRLRVPRLLLPRCGWRQGLLRLLVAGPFLLVLICPWVGDSLATSGSGLSLAIEKLSGWSSSEIYLSNIASTLAPTSLLCLQHQSCIIAPSRKTRATFGLALLGSKFRHAPVSRRTNDIGRGKYWKPIK